MASDRTRLPRSTALALIGIFMQCYKAGLKDADFVRDSLMCTDFKRSVRVPGVFGRVNGSWDMNQREWRITLLHINSNGYGGKFEVELLQNLIPMRSYLSCALTVAQEFYIKGLDDYNDYPHIHEFSLIDNKRLLQWTRQGLKSINRINMIEEIQRVCMLRARIDDENKTKFSIRRYYYDWFASEIWASVILK